MKNIQASLIFLARLLVSLLLQRTYTALAVKNIQASLIFLARLLVSLHSIFGSLQS